MKTDKKRCHWDNWTMPGKSMSHIRKRVVGVGGIFFKAKKPKELSDWYRKHLGIKTEENVALFTWQPRKSSKRVGYTVWSIFPHDTSYFHSKKRQFMINYPSEESRQVVGRTSARGGTRG